MHVCVHAMLHYATCLSRSCLSASTCVFCTSSTQKSTIRRVWLLPLRSSPLGLPAAASSASFSLVMPGVLRWLMTAFGLRAPAPAFCARCSYAALVVKIGPRVKVGVTLACDGDEMWVRLGLELGVGRSVAYNRHTPTCCSSPAERPAHGHGK